MICPKCQTTNPSGNKFCMKCGSPLEQGPQKIKKFLTWTKIIILLISLPSIFLAILLYVYTSIGRPFSIVNDGMAPSYKKGEFVFTRIVNTPASDIIKGSVYILTNPTDSNRLLIRRVIAGPSDTIMLKDGGIYLNGQVIDESAYRQNSEQTLGGSTIKENQSYTVPQNKYFVLSDMRSHSLDSRDLGFIPKENFISKVLFCYWNCK